MLSSVKDRLEGEKGKGKRTQVDDEAAVLTYGHGNPLSCWGLALVHLMLAHQTARIVGRHVHAGFGVRCAANIRGEGPVVPLIVGVVAVVVCLGDHRAVVWRWAGQFQVRNRRVEENMAYLSLCRLDC